MAVLVDANDPGTADITTRELQVAAQSLGLRTHFLNASTERDLDAAFKKVAQIEAGGLVIGAASFSPRGANSSPLRLRWVGEL